MSYDCRATGPLRLPAFSPVCGALRTPKVVVDLGGRWGELGVVESVREGGLKA
jgi:hypothetical protein